MSDERIPRNAPGPFYVAKDECISCRAPEAEARGLMSYDEEGSSCFFERQPTTPEEQYRALRAVWASCCGAVRYAGKDPGVIARLDRLRRGQVATAVTFAAPCGEPLVNLLVRIAENMAASSVGSTLGPATTTPDGDSSWLMVHWPRVQDEKPPPGVELTLSTASDGSGRRLLSIECAVSLQRPAASFRLGDALEMTSGITDLRWYQDLGSSQGETFPV